MSKPRLPFDIEFLMESILSEDPDGVYDAQDKKITSWTNEDARPFSIYDTVSLLQHGGTHFGITKGMLEARYMPHPAAFLKSESGGGIEISSTTALEQEMKHGSLAKLLDMFEKESEYVDDWKDLDDDIYLAGRVNYGISGRVWPSKKILSFWNEQDDVMNAWERIEKFFETFKAILGPIDNYMVDFVERSTDSSRPMVSAGTISARRKSQSSGKPDDKQMNFLDKLSPEQIKVLQRKIHTMKPQEKKRALQAMGFSNHKAADIATKLGMTVAEFNHIMGVNEGEESDMPNLIDLAKQLSKQ